MLIRISRLVDDVFLLASNTLAGGGNSIVNFTAGSNTFTGDDVVIVAEDTVDGLSNVFFAVTSLQVLVDQGNVDSLEDPAGGTGTTEADADTTNFVSGVLGLVNVAAATVIFFNPAAALIGLQEVAFIDVGLFEEELTLFGTIGQGIALSLAQCEEVEGCAPNVTEEELQELIAGLEGRIEELERRLAEEESPAERQRLEELIAGYQEELQNFKGYLEELIAFFAAEEEEFEEDFEEEEFDDFDEEIPSGPPDVQTVETLAEMLKVVNARIQWLESLKDDPVERAQTV